MINEEVNNAVHPFHEVDNAIHNQTVEHFVSRESQTHTYSRAPCLCKSAKAKFYIELFCTTLST